MVGALIAHSHHLHHAPQQIAAVAPVITQGYTMLEAAIASGVSLAVGFGLGWYIKGRGFKGVGYDIENIKKDIEALKARFEAKPVPVVVVPVTNGNTGSTPSV